MGFILFCSCLQILAGKSAKTGQNTAVKFSVSERSGAEHKAFLAPAGALEQSPKNFCSAEWSGAQE